MIEERLRTLVRHLGATKLAESTAITERQRWQTVATNRKVKARIEDMEELLKAFPQYELWLWKGQINPALGQLSPDYEKANNECSRELRDSQTE
ncbi:DNA-binding protein [Stutzerimonas stutzeri]|uniref:DNA-binding protein n=1 Tax=Stutzerimonas stutzeri TaxID=316 RepID=UPI00177D8F65|nr:DNA-binding protein [Stutzerimonas stutzeri]MBD9411166.1 DNA-binding protein [Stutzerimonas stutzeri]